MSETIRFLADVVLIFGVALLMARLLRVIRAPVIVSYLVAGIVIGPAGLALVDEHAVHTLAELGLVLLLFTIGLELSPAPLVQMGPRLLLLTGVQLAVTAGVAAIPLALGFTTLPAALLIGLCVSPSSTAIVLKQLADRREADSAAGTILTGVLLLQDVAVVLLMILLPVLADAQQAGVGAALARGGLALLGLAAVTLVARRLMPLLVHLVFRDSSREMMALFAVVLACAGAWAAGAAGWSMALGSCLAGLLLAVTDVRHQLVAEIAPFRDVFNSLFFVSIGMLVNPGVIAENLPLIVAAVLAALLVKTLVAAGATGLAGWSARLALLVGLGLSTISEFGFVLAREATRHGLLAGVLEPLVACAVGTMLLGALLVPLAPWLVERLPLGGPKATAEQRRATVGPDHVIIVGYGLNGSNLTQVLRATGIPHQVVEINPALASKARSDGATVILGDATRAAILERAGLAAARALVVLINDQPATRAIVSHARRSRPDLYIVARTRYVSELDALRRQGASLVIPEEFETSIEIFAHVLKEFGIPNNVIEQQITMVRAGGYGLLRGQPADRGARLEWLRLLEAAATQTFLLEPESSACGKSIRTLNLRAETGVSIVAITRGGKAVTNPPPEFVLASGDVLVLVGLHRELEVCKALLAPPGLGSNQAQCF